MSKKDMLGQVVRKLVEFSPEILGTFYDLLVKLEEGGERWITELKKFLRKEECWVFKLLEFAGTTTIPETTTDFVASDHFVVTTDDDAEVKISSLNESFKKNFLSKIEKTKKKGVLSFHNLLRSSVDGPIVTELGGENKVETFLSDLFFQIKKQPKREEGNLLVNGCANIFYIRDITGVLWAVDCCWHGAGWSVNASSVESMAEWLDGERVFSPKPAKVSYGTITGL